MKQFFQARYGFALFLAVVTLGIYLPGLQNTLLFDDNLLKNGTIFSGYGSLTEFKQRMLSYGSFVWLDGIFGEGWWKQRLFNIAIHLANIFAIQALVSRILSHAQFSEDTAALPHFTASRSAASQVALVIFALNPVAVYAVAYLIQRSILMATLFSVVACWAFVRWLESRKPGWIALTACAYVFAILSKEYALATLVLMVPIYIFIRRPNKKTLAIATAIALAISAVAAAVFFQIYGHLIGKPFDGQSLAFVQQLEAIRPGVSEKIYPLSILNEAWLFFTYGALWFFPNVGWMSIDLRPVFPLSLTSFPHIVGGAGYVALLAASVWFFWRGRGALSFAALCLLFPLLLFFTEFATVWVQDPLVLYRSYLWAIAVPGLIAVVLTGFSPRTIYTVGGVLALLLSGLAAERNLSLRDGLTAWADAAEKIDTKAPANAVGRWQAFLNLGGYHVEQGSRAEARKALHTALALGENNGYALFNLGLADQYDKKHAQALTWFARSEAKGFAMPMLHYHRGESLFALGQWEQAYQSLSQSLTTPLSPPEHTKYRTLRAEAALAAQQYDVAIADFELLLKDTPQSSRLLQGLGLAQVGKGNAPAALAIFNPLVAQSPNAAAYYGRAMAHLKAGNKEASLKDLDQTIALEPGNPRYRDIRAQIAADRAPR